MKYSSVFLLALAGSSSAQLPKGKGIGKAGGSAGGCSPLEIVIARATTESAGYGIVCGPLLTATQKLVPGTTGYAVKYPADFSKSSPDVGVADTVNHIKERAAACPEQKYALSGYSQGAVVMHRAAVKLDKSILKDRIIATATFGDGGQQATKANPVYDSPVGPIPVWPDELEGKIKFNCAKGDLTCTPGGSSTLAHMTYGTGTYINDSAKFIQQAFQKGASGPGRKI